MRNMRRILVAIVALMMVVALSAAASAEDAKLEFKKTSYEVIAGEVLDLWDELTQTGEPGELTWKSSDLQVASVYGGDVYTGERLGEVTITVTGSKGGSASTKVTVKDNPVTKIELNQSTWTVNEGEEVYLQAKLTYKDSKKSKPLDFYDVIWTSSDPKVATVRNYGYYAEVEGVEAGKTTITATIINLDGTTVTAEATVTVQKPKLTSIAFPRDKYTVKLTPDYASEDLTLNAKPVNVYVENITYTSSDERIASVYGYGDTCTIYPHKPGEVTITATYDDDPTITAKTVVTIEKTAISKVSLNKTKLTLVDGRQTLDKSINFQVEPWDAYYDMQATYWDSSDNEIINVTHYDDNYVWLELGRKYGTATITVHVSDGEKEFTASCEVTTVAEKTGITLDPTSKKIYIKKVADESDETQEFYIAAYSANGDELDSGSITWTSSDKKVATVSKYGKVKAVGAGDAVITATAPDGSTATCKVTVELEQSGISLSQTSRKLYVKKDPVASDEKAGFLLEAYSENGDELDGVKFTSSDKKVAVVNKNGWVQSVGKGAAVITATAPDGSTATCNVTVEINKKVKKIKGNKQITLRVGQTDSIWLYINTKPSIDTLYNPKFIFKSSNNGIVSVNSDGILKANGTGTATVIVKAKDGSKKTFKMKVKVIAAVQ